ARHVGDERADLLDEVGRGRGVERPEMVVGVGHRPRFGSGRCVRRRRRLNAKNRAVIAARAAPVDDPAGAGPSAACPEAGVATVVLAAAWVVEVGTSVVLVVVVVGGSGCRPEGSRSTCMVEPR